MSRKYTPQFADRKGDLINVPGKGIVFASLAATPTSAAKGYAKGCIFVNTAGSLGSFVYANTKTRN